MKILTALLFFIVAIVFYPSCKKSDSLKNQAKVVDSASVFGYNDSTHSIISINESGYDSASGAMRFPTTTYYYYDTLNTKIILSSVPISSLSQSYNGKEFIYNNAGFLTHITYKYSPATTDTTVITDVDFIYDGQNVISSASYKLFGGRSITENFTKTALTSNNYQLSWKSNHYGNINTSDSASFFAIFNSKGELTNYYQRDSLYLNIYSYVSDTLMYDANGSISKIIETFFPSSVPNTPQTYTLLNFISRDTRGNQISKHYQMLYKGIANFPVALTIPQYIADWHIESNSETYQFINYPSFEYYWHDSHITSSAQYDSENRLINYNSNLGGRYEITTIKYYR